MSNFRECGEGDRREKLREEEVIAEHWEGDLSVEWEKADRPLELGERVISLEG